ncbi:MAG: hypothetical protein LAT76_06070, partial [Schleiferiaceae bacterium]|nr:hypothetical protein [Schleiferiaceae bacterium]
FLFSLTLFILNVWKQRLPKTMLVLSNTIAVLLCMAAAFSFLFLINQRFVKKQGQQKWASRTENTLIHGNSKYAFGIDVSHYNGIIDWPTVKRSKHPIKFVFVRTTMGKNGIDYRYKTNLRGAEKEGFLVGTYHYFRPNENFTEQFENFKQHAIVERGHMYPVLDIEQPSKLGNANLVKGLKNWLQLAEKEYGVKPIIYTGRHFYNT